jgi:hypothetical protein
MVERAGETFGVGIAMASDVAGAIRCIDLGTVAKISRAFMHGFREAFPDLSFLGTTPLLADGDHVIGQWEGGGRTPATWSPV